MAIYSSRSQCEGKHRWRRRRDARKALRHFQTSPDVDSHGLGIYRCPHCAWFHVGHDPALRR